MEKSKKKFLKTPHLDGGRELLKAFIKDNLIYPEQALLNAIEGDVIIRFRVTGKAEIIDPHVVKGIGYGCDEEALRLVNLLHFQSVNNRGFRVITNNRIKIPFRLPKGKQATAVRVAYHVSPKTPSKTNTGEPGKISYNYTVKVNNPG